MVPIDLITVSREFGAGGSVLAEMLGKQLGGGWRVVDRQLVHMVATKLGVADQEVEERDEHAPGLIERIGATLLRTSPDLVAAPESVRLPPPAAIVGCAKDLLINEAKRPPVIVVGHGTQVLFHNRPGSLHVRLVASIESRVRRICKRTNCVDREAAELANRIDQDRAHYIRHYFNRDWTDGQLYHLQLNTALLGLDESTRLIVSLVEGRKAPVQASGATSRGWAATDPNIVIPPTTGGGGPSNQGKTDG